MLKIKSAVQNAKSQSCSFINAQFSNENAVMHCYFVVTRTDCKKLLRRNFDVVLVVFCLLTFW